MIINLSTINLGGSGGGGGSTTVIDNLESTSTTAALSANQGKVLGDHISDAEFVLVKANETTVMSDSVRTIVPLTQSEYDTLEAHGELDYNTLYAIIPE